MPMATTRYANRTHLLWRIRGRGRRQARRLKSLIGLTTIKTQVVMAIDHHATNVYAALPLNCPISR
jgi:hypothetical protein